MSWFTDRTFKKEIAALESALITAKGESKMREKKALDNEAGYNRILKVKNDLDKELTKVKKLVREQTGADLLVNALMELGVVPKPEKHDSFAEQNRLNQQMMAAAQHDRKIGLGQVQSSFGNLFGGGTI